MTWQEEYKSKLTTPEAAAGTIQSGDVIWTTNVSESPIHILNALCDRRDELKDVNLYAGLMLQPFDFMKGDFAGHIKYHCEFLGPVERMFVQQGNIDVTSMHLSRLSWSLRNLIKPKIMLATCTPPDQNGYMNAGPTAVGFFSSFTSADRVIVQVNKNTPYVYGERNSIHVSEVDLICEADYDLPTLPNPPVTETEKLIASQIAPYIKDGDTLQIGIGGIGNAVAYFLEDRKNLGVHTEMLVDSLVYLAKKGVITGNRKNFNKRKIIFGFAAGGKELHEFLDRNPLCEKKPIEYTNDLMNIAANDNMVSINSAIAVDLTGQVCSESIGFRQFSSTGGQLDFVRGSAMSNGGRSFIALASTAETKNGLVSKINVALPPGSVVTTPRADVHYIATEYGVADLTNKSISARIEEMLKIAHPDFRESLRKEAHEAGHLF